MPANVELVAPAPTVAMSPPPTKLNAGSFAAEPSGVTDERRGRRRGDECRDAALSRRPAGSASA